MFKDFKPKVRGKTCGGTFYATYEIVKRKGRKTVKRKGRKTVKRKGRKTVSLQDLEAYVERVAAQMKASKKEDNRQRQFYGYTRQIGKQRFYVLTQKSRTEQGRRVKGRVPIYFELSKRKRVKDVWIPQSYIRRSRRLCSYLIMRVCGYLGISKSVLFKKLGRVKKGEG